MDTWFIEVKKGGRWEETNVKVPINHLTEDTEDKDIILKLRDVDRDFLLDYHGENIRLISPFFDTEETEVLHFEVNEFRNWTFYKNHIIALDPKNKYKMKV
ncbi:hypothetical protein [Halobacillus seohaensis]|uniref:Uncharacterized protein n=1 Tax=Halobacillus seohaensis TaxID=447421 RepID=A0ABW2ENQ2_9BACI